MAEANIVTAVAGLVGVVIGGTMTNLQKWIEYRVTKGSSARYFAARMITTLDHFIAECLVIAEDHGTAEPDGNISVKLLPKLELEKLDIDWKSVNSEVVYLALQIPNEYAAAVRAINAGYDRDAPPYHDFEERQFRFAHLGLIAYGLINYELIKIGNLKLQGKGRDELAERLEEIYRDISEQRQEREEARKRAFGALVREDISPGS